MLLSRTTPYLCKLYSLCLYIINANRAERKACFQTETITSHGLLFIFTIRSFLSVDDQEIFRKWALSSEGYDFFRSHLEIFLISKNPHDTLLSMFGLSAYNEIFWELPSFYPMQDAECAFTTLSKLACQGHPLLGPVYSLRPVLHSLLSTLPNETRDNICRALHFSLIQGSSYKDHDPLYSAIQIYSNRRIWLKEPHHRAFAEVWKRLDTRLQDLGQYRTFVKDQSYTTNHRY